MWAASHDRFLDVIAGRFVATGTWPTRLEIARDLARMEPPIAVGGLLADMPRSIGWQGSEGRITLTLFALQHAEAATPIIEGFMKLLRIAVGRFRTPDGLPVPPLNLYDIEALDLPPGQAHALSEVVLREAPFIGSGVGGPVGFWEREITDAVMRYYAVQTIQEYLAIRQEELQPRPAFLAQSSAIQPFGASDVAEVTTPQRATLLNGTLGAFVVVAGVLPFVTESPWWVTGGAIGASGAFAWLRHRRQRS